MQQLPTPINIQLDAYDWTTSYARGVETMQIVLFANGQAFTSFNVQVDDEEAKAAGYSDEFYNTFALSKIGTPQTN